MAHGGSFTLTELARRLDVPQHRLIHLCEKGVVIPEVHAASGRGSSRIFSPLNYLELTVALRLREMFVPVSTLRGIIHVLRTFGRHAGGAGLNQPLVESLRQDNSPELRIVLSDGRLLYFTLRSGNQPPRLFGGVPLEGLGREQTVQSGYEEQSGRGRHRKAGDDEFGGPESSEFVRLELSVNAVARSLQLD